MSGEIEILRMCAAHKNYKTHFSKSRRIKHRELKRAIEDLKTHGKLSINVAGKSIEEREIFLIKWGTGKKKILLWSQMHGDEPTATLSILDTLNFLVQKDEFDVAREFLASNLTVYFLPMLNPDGAERVTRENAIGIDLNRDAAALTSPESKVLFSSVKTINPDFAFNLHDQDTRWAAGETTVPAALSLLAPPYNDSKDSDNARKIAMKLVVYLFNQFSQQFPGVVAKYKDDHEPRSFGDTIAGLGISTILIESGRLRGDDEKEKVREMNFAAYLISFNAAASDCFGNEILNEYYEIPDNGQELYELILRNVSISTNGRTYKVDIAIDVDEIKNGNFNGEYFSGIIQIIGDLKGRYGLKEVDCSGLYLECGKYSEEVYQSEEELNESIAEDYLSRGILFIRVKRTQREFPFSKIPINLISNTSVKMDPVSPGKSANFVLKKNNKIEMIVLNGFLFHPAENLSAIKNGLIF